MTRLKPLNPLDALFRVDNAQTNFFKRAVFYNKVKRQAYRRMNRNFGQMVREQTKLSNILGLGPEKAMSEIIAHPEQLEKAAKATLDVLGDYTNYTRLERRGIRRVFLFYGFLRYALRTLFYTLPVKHPVATAVAAQLGNLHNDEVRDLLGGPEAPWAYSRIYFGSGDKLRSIDLARINPVSNPIFDVIARGPRGAAGLVSPLMAVLLDQVYGEHAFTGKKFTGKGSAQEGSGLGGNERIKVATADLLSMFAPYRIAHDVRAGGRKTTDASLLWNIDPMVYKTPAAQARHAAEDQARGGGGSVLLSQLSPFVPKGDTAIFAARAARERKGKKSGRRRVRAGGLYSGAGSSGLYGGSTSGGLYGGGP
jgi:hypothetical protein